MNQTGGEGSLHLSRCQQSKGRACLRWGLLRVGVAHLLLHQVQRQGRTVGEHW
jgi:hypothetical protein